MAGSVPEIKARITLEGAKRVIADLDQTTEAAKRAAKVFNTAGDALGDGGKRAAEQIKNLGLHTLEHNDETSKLREGLHLTEPLLRSFGIELGNVRGLSTLAGVSVGAFATIVGTRAVIALENLQDAAANARKQLEDTANVSPADFSTGTARPAAPGAQPAAGADLLKSLEPLSEQLGATPAQIAAPYSAALEAGQAQSLHHPGFELPSPDALRGTVGTFLKGARADLLTEENSEKLATDFFGSFAKTGGVLSKGAFETFAGQAKGEAEQVAKQLLAQRGIRSLPPNTSARDYLSAGLDTGAFGGGFTFGQTAQAVNTLAPKFEEDFANTPKQLPDSIRAVKSAFEEMAVSLGRLGLADKLNDAAKYLRNFGGGLDYLMGHGFGESAKVLGDDFSNRVAPYIPNRETVQRGLDALPGAVKAVGDRVPISIEKDSIADALLPKEKDFEDFAALPGKIVAAIADFDARLKAKGSSWQELLTGIQAAPEGPVPQRATGISPTARTLEPGQWRGGIVAAAALAGGGPIIGPGTGTSDSITMSAEPGAFILKESAARRAGRQALNMLHGYAGGGVPIRVSNGEEYFTRAEVNHIGLSALRDLNATGASGTRAKKLLGFADGDEVSPYGRPLQPGDPGFSRPLQPGDLYYPRPIGPGESGYARPGTANITRGRGYGEAQSEADFAAYAASQGRAEAILGTERNKEARAQISRSLAYGQYQKRWLSSRLGEHSAGDVGAARARIFGGDPGPSQHLENLIPGHGLDLRNIFQYRTGGMIDLHPFSVPKISLPHYAAGGDVDQSRFDGLFASSGVSMPSADVGGLYFPDLRNSTMPSIAASRISEARPLETGSGGTPIHFHLSDGRTVSGRLSGKAVIDTLKREGVKDLSRRAGRASPWVGT
jgi:hypothetical protein